MQCMSDEKPKYFANGDFEKVAADIICSPRRLKSTQDSYEELFRITDKQNDYYRKCFKHLMKNTQGVIDMNGALCGADQRVISFFKKSSLSVPTLSKIWSLADVNEDGWLSLAEFSIAMHLVVLHVKGEVPIPDQLPSFSIPAMTPRRTSSQGDCSGTPSASSSIVVPNVTSNEETVEADERLPSTQPIIKQFSDTPPLLVDSRPTAIKHSALLALKSPSGPPPVPPPRPQQRGHGRSASLDLKLVAFNKLQQNQPETRAPPTTLALWTNVNNLPNEGIIEANKSTTSTKSPYSNVASTTTTNFASFPTTPDNFAPQPPPVPSRVSPSIKKTEEPKFKQMENKSTQTEIKIYDEEEIKNFFDNFGNKIENLLGEEVEAAEGQGLEKWARRCETLKLQNAELEEERARLAQVRLQLECRLAEFNQNIQETNL